VGDRTTGFATSSGSPRKRSGGPLCRRGSVRTSSGSRGHPRIYTTKTGARRSADYWDHL